MSTTLLIELRTEELPPKALSNLSATFAQGVFDQLLENGFLSDGATFNALCSPRRLAVTVSHVLPRQSDRIIERKGPAIAAGLDESGQPTKALAGFLRSAGVTFEQLSRSNDGKAECFVARIEKKGETLAQHLASYVATSLKKLPAPKLMRWGNSDHQFVRPVHGLIMMLGDQLIAGEVLGLSSNNRTLGHRFLSHGEIVIPHASEYIAKMETEGKVLVDASVRKTRINEQLLAKAKELGASINSSADLLNEVTALVEWPVIYVGEFEPEFLDVPQECLVLTMQQNQKYFPLLDNNDKLINKFLIVSNMSVADPVHIVSGNARVVRPRLADARFFFTMDRKARLETRLPRLGKVVYHNKIGTQLQRAERLARLAGIIAQQLAPTDSALTSAAERAGRLAKADLVTDMVGEFPELQGTMGRYYALADGETTAVAEAIGTHYQPRFSGDSLPQGHIAAAVAMADKLDALVGFFGIGQLPTGDKDPFGLRRAALGVLRILVENRLPLSLAKLIEQTAAGFTEQLSATRLNADFESTLLDFFYDRLRGHLREADYAQDAIEAVLTQRPARIDQVPAKLDAVRTFAALPEAEALAAANKRIGNILKKSDFTSGQISQPDIALMHEPAEKALFECVTRLSPQIEAMVLREDYAGALKALAGVRTEVDRFFDEVMVMADDPAVRTNRLALLTALFAQLNAVADISRLAG